MLLLLLTLFEFASDNTTSENAGFRPRLSTGLGSCFSSFTFLREGITLQQSRQDGVAGTVTFFFGGGCCNKFFNLRQQVVFYKIVCESLTFASGFYAFLKVQDKYGLFTI